MLSRGALHIAALGLLAACGPNYRYVYDGESAFERCYANDFDAAVTPAVRSRCWQEWLQAYSYGGAADRVEFARGRLTALETQSAAPPPPSPASPGAPGPASPSPAQASASPPPVPAAPSAPPAPTPGLGEPWRAVPHSLPSTAPSPTQAAPQADPPGAACANACRAAWQLAAGRCAQRDASCVAQSDEGYRDCMRGCF